MRKKADLVSVYFTRVTGEDGRFSYSLIYQGAPLMANTTDPNRAVTVYEQFKASFKGARVGYWDGDAGKFGKKFPELGEKSI